MITRTLLTLLILLANSHLSWSLSCTEDHFEDQEIDFDRSYKAGVTIKELGGINVSSAEECAKSCCEESSEKCNIVKFNANQSFCVQYLCEPLEKCSFKENQLIRTIKLQEKSNEAFNVTQPSSKFPSETSENSIATTTPVAAAAAATTTTAATEDIITSTVINITLTTEDTYNVTNVTEHSINVTNDEETISSSELFISTTEKEIPESKLLNITELFLDNQSTTVMKNKTSQGRKGVGNEPTENPNPTTQPTTTTTKRISTSTAQLELVDEPLETTPVIFEVTVGVSIIEVNDVKSMSNNDTEQQAQQIEPTPESEQLRKSIHLIVALVIGLVLLITVLGLVVRRFYDGWQRRHYQRMDFLIDGMYNIPPT